MLQLTSEERARLRERAQAHADLLNAMLESVYVLMAEPILAPHEGIANWKLYYYCPQCSVMLTYDRYDSAHHRCPQCGAVYTGEPYDSTWWGFVNEQNQNGAMTLGWLYVMTGERCYARKAADILLTYAERYPHYQVHGDIPYNGPGRVGAQTLDEANFQRDMAIAYDLTCETLAQAEREVIRDRLFLPGASFLMERRHNQLHNHEVIVSSAIAVIGLLFDRQDMIDFALNQPYGIVYQLEHGMQDNGMWFEGSVGYHFYALRSFLAYEKFAMHTPYSHVHHPNYAKMLSIMYDYLQPDGELPLLGDTKLDHFANELLLYEFMYRELHEPTLLAMLHSLYQHRSRDSLEALLYGVDTLPPCPALQPANPFHPPVGCSGHTVLRGSGQRYLLLKHDRYGGEHDHYDRLGLSYLALGQAVAPDLGTTGYGATLHYDYYKNTGAHNTVNIGGANQSPADAVLTRFEQVDGVTYVEMVCDWSAPYQMPDSFTIVQWDESAYRNVKMTRRIAWTDAFWAESFLAEGVEDDLAIDWVFHLSGRHEGTTSEDGQPVMAEVWPAKVPLSEKKPYRHISRIQALHERQALCHTFSVGGVQTRVHSAAFDGLTLLGSGLDNPSYREMPYLIERAYGKTAVFAHVIESYAEEPILEKVTFTRDGEGISISVMRKGADEKDMVLRL